MLVTQTTPGRQGNETRLHVTLDEARAGAGAGHPIFGVAAPDDGQRHRLLPLDSGSMSPNRTIPARFQDGGFVVTPALLLPPLFLGR